MTQLLNLSAPLRGAKGSFKIRLPRRVSSGLRSVAVARRVLRRTSALGSVGLPGNALIVVMGHNSRCLVPGKALGLRTNSGLLLVSRGDGRWRLRVDFCPFRNGGGTRAVYFTSLWSLSLHDFGWDIRRLGKAEAEIRQLCEAGRCWGLKSRHPSELREGCATVREYDARGDRVPCHVKGHQRRTQ